MMNTEKDRKRIFEFLDLLGNESYELRRYSHPILVYKVENGIVYYSLWEEEILQRFGLKNVDGWDYKDDSLFCPDWVIGIEHDDLIDELDELDEMDEEED